MGFFDNLGKKASEAYNIAADKTGRVAKDTKIKVKMADLKAKVNNEYEVIGKMVYENHVSGTKASIKKELEEECAKIDDMSNQIEELKKESLKLRDKKRCPKCNTEMDRDVKFCPQCGEKQEEIIDEEVEEDAKEVEIVEDEKEENKDEEDK